MSTPGHDGDASADLATRVGVEVGARLQELEAVIERGKHVFLEVGRALLVIREERRYKERGFTSFEDYCQEHWGFSRSYSHRLIEAAEVVEVLPMGNTPATERVARELAPLKAEPEKIQAAWAETVGRHGPTPTAAQTREVVQEVVAPAPAPLATDPAEEWFDDRTKSHKESRSELFRIDSAVKPCQKVDWGLLTDQVVRMTPLERRALAGNASVLESTARQIRERLETKLEAVR